MKPLPAPMGARAKEAFHDDSGFVGSPTKTFSSEPVRTVMGVLWADSQKPLLLRPSGRECSRADQECLLARGSASQVPTCWGERIESLQPGTKLGSREKDCVPGVAVYPAQAGQSGVNHFPPWASSSLFLGAADGYLVALFG